MDRRRFMALGALTGLTAGVTVGVRKLLYAQQPGGGSALEPYTGRFYIMINAGGGWDPTMVCDPKGGTINRGFTTDQIRTAGAISYAPVTYTTRAGAYSNQQFFDKFSSRLLVLNGVDMSTNNHDTGQRFTWSGHLEDGYPPLAALIAAALAPGRPLGFLSNGGYEYTAGVAPLTRLNGVGTISRIAYPNRIDPANAMSTYHTPTTYARIQQAQAARLAAMGGSQTLAVYRDSMQQMLAARGGSNLLERMMMFLPSNNDLNGANNNILSQGMIALAAYQAGITAAVNLDTGGFDTHSNHDTNQANALGELLSGVDRLMDRIDMLGLTDRVVVMIGSDFGRTPFYNAMGTNGGKDHWSVTSIMMMGAGIAGNRVIGASDDRQRARGFNASTLAADDSSPVKLNPRAIHMALRRFAGIDGADVSRQFPIIGENLALFG
jgi:uncharacterized protein (DUF1501 family)